MFLWVSLPEDLDSHALFQAAVEDKVAFVPGDPFFPNPEDGRRCLRLNFSNASVEQTQEGIHRLGRTLRAMMPLASAGFASA